MVVHKIFPYDLFLHSILVYEPSFALPTHLGKPRSELIPKMRYIFIFCIGTEVRIATNCYYFSTKLF